MIKPQRQTTSTLNKTGRMVTLNHPNSFDALMFRRFFTTATDDNSLYGGVKILGNEDTAEVDYNYLGVAKVLFLDPWQASNSIKGGIYADDGRVRILSMIECNDDTNIFEPEKGDVFYLKMNDDLALCYEVVGIENPVGLPSMLNAVRYVLNKRDDLDYIKTASKNGENFSKNGAEVFSQEALSDD